jgi:hypothetical protein
MGDEVIREWRKLYKEEISDLYSTYFSGKNIRKMKWAGHVARMGENRGIYGVLVGKA